MATIDVTKELWIRCDSCRSELDVTYDEINGNLAVTPCEKCLKAERDDGYAEGLEQSQSEE